MNMTPQQAITLLDSAVAQIAAPRNDHASLQTAILVLNELVKANETKEEKDNND